MDLPTQASHLDTLAWRPERVGTALRAAARATTRAERDQLIRAACNVGASPKEICAALGMDRLEVLGLVGGQSRGQVLTPQ